LAMDRFSSARLRSARGRRASESAQVPAHIVPFGPYGAGQWTGHWIGLVIVVGFVAMGLAGIPEWRGFFLASIVLGAVVGCVLWLWHRARSPF
jgi:hypothetical protein